MKQSPWQDLIIERRGVPPSMADDHFRDWMTGRAIFVSSVMDVEMMPARDAVRAWILNWGAEPVMWEEITPRDHQAQHAYLDGVDRSDLFVLLLGSRYGVSDDTGYSPTHQEGNRARERGIHRMLFEPTNVIRQERDGKLNDWVASLYNEVSGGKYSDSADLVRKLENRVREIASAQETPWVKIGRLVLPGTVDRRGGAGTTTYEVRSRLRDPETRRAVARMADRLHHSDADRLTLGIETAPIGRVEVQTRTIRTSEDEATFICQHDTRHGGATWAGGMTINGVGPENKSGYGQTRLYSTCRLHLNRAVTLPIR